jgi:hypothetical protein
MDDAWVTVPLVGGPMDGTAQPMERTAVYGDPNPGSDPLVWRWKGWVA